MNYLSWADGSARIGLGHLSRQMMLAHALADGPDSRAGVTLVTDASLDALRPFEAGFDSVHLLPARSDADRQIELVSELLGETEAAALIIDKPEYPDRFCDSLRHLRSTYERLSIAAFDAAAAHPGCVDLIIDANVSPVDARRFSGSETQALFGPDYAVVAADFGPARGRFEVTKRVERVVISMGGSDPNFVTALALEAALTLSRTAIDVVLGPAFSERSLRRLRAIDGGQRVAFHQGLTHGGIASLLAQADACIVSGGITMFEVCAVGLPALVISQNAKQLLNANHLAEYGAIVNLGLFSEVSTESAAEALALWEWSMTARKTLSKAAKSTVDGKGIERICSAIHQLIDNAR